MLNALVNNLFQDAIYPVNPKAPSISYIPASPSVRDLPETPDLAIIAVPRDSVLGVIDDCAARGVRAVVVITAGFAEVGEEGRALQQRLVERIRDHGMRMVGPNCMDLLNTDPAVQLNASFSPVFPPPGRVANVVPERRARPGDSRSRARARARAFELRERRQQGRRLR